MLYFAELVGKNNKTYRVELLTDGDAVKQQELQLVASGLIVRIDGAKDIFAPLRGGSASITVRTDELLPFYTTDPMAVSATIYEDDNILFFGYVTPSVYSSAWAPRATELTIECRDALSVLADLEYDSDGDIDTFADLLNKAIAKVGAEKLTLDVVEPFNISLSNLSVIKGNWYDEGGEASKWSEVLEAILQWSNCRLTQWRDKWYVNDFRHVRATSELDALSCDANPAMSLTDVHQKNKLEVSLYEDSSDIIDAFDGWNLVASERYFQSQIKGIPENWDTYLSFYESGKIEQAQYLPNSIGTIIDVENTGDAMSKRAGAWLVSSSSGEFKQHPSHDKIHELEDHNEAKKYIVVATPYQKVPWRNSVLAANFVNYSAFTLRDPVRRIFADKQILIINATALISTNPTPVLCRKLGGEFFDGATGDTSDYTTSGAPSLLLRFRIGEHELGYVSGGVPGWFEDKNDHTYTNRIGIPLYGTRIENPFNRDFTNVSNVYQFYIASDGYGISLKDGLEGHLEIDVLLYSGDQRAESAWISDFRVSLGYESTAIEKFRYDSGDVKDVEYENETDDVYSEPYELTLSVSTKASNYNYSRSAVYENTSGANKAVSELVNNITGENAIAEHHLLDAMTVQNQVPRMVFEGTWRNHVANPVSAYHSENLDRLFIVESIEVDCDASTSTMKIEELYG
jgi:hypothetical protein